MKDCAPGPPADLFSSEFFGHEKGAFRGAVQDKRGFFEKADGGTLLIDELSPPVQAKLLRALQSGEFFRLGSTEQRGADVPWRPRCWGVEGRPPGEDEAAVRHPRGLLGAPRERERRRQDADLNARS